MSEIGEAYAAVGSAFTMIDPPELFPDLPALANRLGVPKNKGNAAVVLTMKNGDAYSLFALINAVLDRLDSAAK